MATYYLNFREDGSIWKVGNVLDTKTQYIEIDRQLLMDFSDCKKQFEDYIVVPSESEAKYELKFKHTSLEDFDVDKSIHQIPKDDQEHRLNFILVQDTKNGLWKAKLSKDLKTLLTSTLYYKDKTHKLFVTDEDDPNVLLDTLSVEFSKLFETGEALIENSKKEVAQRHDVSVYCGKAFEYYSHVVEK